MSWYTNLSSKQIKKTHVHVTYKNGDTLNCRLNEFGDIANPSYVFNAEILRVSSDNVSWEIADENIESVDFVWSEQEMEPIDIKEMNNGDYAVLHNGHCERIFSVNNNCVLTDFGHSINKDCIATILREKQSLPNDLGSYITDTGEMVIHTNKFWTVIGPHYEECGKYTSDTLPVKYRNLVPAEIKVKEIEP